MAKKLLITGASGFLGWQVCENAPKAWNIVGTWHSNPNGLNEKAQAIQLDLLDKDAIWKLLKNTAPDAVLHLAAASNPAHCEANPMIAKALNVTATTWLAEMCAERSCKFLFTSSSQVYDGVKSPFSEDPTPSPTNEYGRQKLAAEQAIMAISSSSAIIRVAVMYGSAGSGPKNFLQQWREAWQNGDSVTAFHDEIRSFLSGKSAAAGINLLLEKGAEGIFNLGGGTSVSRFEFAELARRALHLPEAKIISKSQLEVETKAFRPANLTMDLNKIIDLGFVPEYNFESLKTMKS